MNNHLPLILSLVIITSCLVPLGMSCSCMKSSRRDIFCSNNFAGIVYIKGKAEECTEWNSCYEISVKRRFKPHHGMVQQILTANHTGGCGHQFQVGTEYLVMGQILDAASLFRPHPPVVSSDSMSSSKAEVYSCSLPVIWSDLTYLEKKEILSEIRPTDACNKRKRVLQG